MKYIHRYLLIICYAWFLPSTLWAAAPVVDDSENFALLDEQQVAERQPATTHHERYSFNDSSDQQPLAHDTVDSGNSDTSGLLNKIQGLQQDLQELRGQLEVQAHDLKSMQQQQLDFYKDLDGRIRQNEPKKAQQSANPESASATTPTDMTLTPADDQAKVAIAQKTKAAYTPVTTGTSNPADEQLTYLSAYELVKNKHYSDAIVAMQRFLQQYPQGGYSGNAHYWLGELYMLKQDYPQAISHFEIVLRDFPSSSKSSASMLKIAYALASSGKKEEAKIRLKQVMKAYPDTHTAQLAINKLKYLQNS